MFNPVEKPFNPSGRFIATIAATDHKSAMPNTAKPAAFGVVIQGDADGAIQEFDFQHVQADNADENEALVLAVRHLLDCSDEGAQITLRSSSTYIISTIKEYLAFLESKRLAKK